MRDLLIFGIVFGLLPFALKRPVIGIFLYTWISLMNPHRLTYGAAYDFPFAMVIAVVTIVGMLLSKKPQRFPISSLTFLLLGFTGWMAFTTIFALEHDLASREFERVMKTIFISLVAMAVIKTEKEVKVYAWVLALSLGFYGLKGGLFTLVTGGTSHVVGPSYTYIGDNNALALALVTVVPLIWYCKMHAGKKWLRRAMALLGMLTLIAVIGSYSRGALLGLIAMLFFLWLKSRMKLRTGLAVLLVVPIIYSVMPDKWFQRMDTIKEYKQDESAMGRINSWQFAINVATANPLGGGFRVFTPNMFTSYAPNPQIFFDAHSIYFQVLGEHGFVGLLWFLLLMGAAWRTGSRIMRKCKGRENLKWMHDLAAMCQVSIIGYSVAGAFLTLAYYDLYYFIIVLLATLDKLMIGQTNATDMKSKSSSLHEDWRAHGGSI